MCIHGRESRMNSKERVKNAINRQPVDRAPLGVYAIDHDTVSKVLGRPTYVRNKPAQQIAIWEGRRDEVAESIKQDVIELFEKLDCIDLLTMKEACYLPPRGYKPEKPIKKLRENVYQDEFGRVWQSVPTANEIAIIEDPTKPKDLPMYSEEEFADRTLPEIPDPSCFEVADHLVAHFKDDRYIASFSGALAALPLLNGTEYGLMTVSLQPEIIKAYNEQLVFTQNFLDQYRIRPGVDGALIEQDMAGTNGPLVSPDTFRELCFPYMKARLANVKKYVPQVLFHNCGNNLPLMDMFIEAGIDAYESIQTTSAMNVKTLIQRFGDRLCVWGAVPLEVLITGDTDDTRKAVRQCFEDAGDAPGFILGPSHSIAFGTKYENFMAMLDEFDKLRDRKTL